MSRHSKNREENQVPRERLEKLLEKIRTRDVDKVILFSSSRDITESCG